MATQPGPGELIGCNVYADRNQIGKADGYRGVVVEIFPPRERCPFWGIKFEYPQRFPKERPDFGWINELTWDGQGRRCNYYKEVRFERELHDRSGQLSFF